MKFNYNDGGRSKYFKGEARDCVVRAIAIATGKDYKEVYNEVAKIIGYTPRNSIKKKTEVKKIMQHFDFKWVSTMSIGTGCTIHLREDELPNGIIVASVSHHLTCIIDGVVNDTFNPSRDGTRCVYGYWYKEV